MPCMPAHKLQRHRPKEAMPLFNACVARPVSAKEIAAVPKAQAAKQAEWDRLRSVKQPDGQLGAWEESEVQELWRVKKQAKDDNVNLHIGRIFDFVVEKTLNFQKTSFVANTKAVPCSRARTSKTSPETGQSSRTWVVTRPQWKRPGPAMPLVAYQAMPHSSAMLSRPIRRHSCKE